MAPEIFTRDGYVFFSPIKPPIKMKFWHIHSMERLKRELKLWLDGDIPDGEQIRRIQRRRSATSLETGRSRTWLEEVEGDRDVMMMMHAPDDIVLVLVIS